MDSLVVQPPSSRLVDEIKSGTVNSTTPTTIDSLTRAVEGSDVAHASGASVEFYMVNGIPLTEVNKTHTQLGNIGIDSLYRCNNNCCNF